MTNQFEEEKVRFDKELQALKQQSEGADASLLDLKVESARILLQLKSRLEKFICWPEVQDLGKELEDAIAKLNKSQ